MDLHDVLKQIHKLLIISQFAEWIDSRPETAAEANSQEQRAYDYYNGNVVEDVVFSSNQFRCFVNTQAAYIGRILNRNDRAAGKDD